MNSETQTIIAKRYLGSATCEDYVDWAMACLEADIDSKNIRILASLQKPLYPSEVDDYFYRSLNDLGWTMPEERESLLQYARLLAQQIVSDDLPPVEGCRKMYDIVVALEYPSELIPWIYLEDGVDPNYVGDLTSSDWDDAIKNEAEYFLRST